MSDYHINIFYSDEDGAYVADIPDLEACSALVGKVTDELAAVADATVIVAAGIGYNLGARTDAAGL